MKTVVVSGGMDPLHKGHIRLFKEAAKMGELIVILNNDNWLFDKKGFVFQNQKERKEIIEAIKYVNKVIITEHIPSDADISVCKELEKIKPNLFVNGGDRQAGNIPEYKLCESLGIKMEFNVGGEKIQSSSELVKKIG